MDYSTLPGEQVIISRSSMEGDTECVTVAITNDATPEPTEHFTIMLSSDMAEVAESMSIHTVTIEDDDSESFNSNFV